MRRRELFKAAAVGALAVAAPRIGRAEPTNKLVFVPTEDLGALDPVIIGIRSTRNHAYLVFDTLYGIDTSWMAQPQMVEGHQVDEAGLTWTLTLREGLRFHDNEPVLARDVVASIHRFAARISFANADGRNRGTLGARRSHFAPDSILDDKQRQGANMNKAGFATVNPSTGEEIEAFSYFTPAHTEKVGLI